MYERGHRGARQEVADGGATDHRGSCFQGGWTYLWHLGVRVKRVVPHLVADGTRDEFDFIVAFVRDRDLRHGLSIRINAQVYEPLPEDVLSLSEEVQAFIGDSVGLEIHDKLARLRARASDPIVRVKVWDDSEQLPEALFCDGAGKRFGNRGFDFGEQDA